MNTTRLSGKYEKALEPWGSSSYWKNLPIPIRNRSTQASMIKRKWNSLDFLLDHAQRDIDSGNDINAYVREFCLSPWVKRLQSPVFANLMSAKRLKKEIVEAYAVINLLRRTVNMGNKCDRKNDGEVDHKLKQPKDYTQNSSRKMSAKFDGSGMLVIDLCSGKGFTATMMNFVFPRATIIAVDRDPRMRMSHISHLPRVRYHHADICSPQFSSWLRKVVKSFIAQTQRYPNAESPSSKSSPSPPPRGRFVVMVGMHLCGTLSEVAVREFNRNHGISALVLCPCCMPKKEKGQRLTELSRRLNRKQTAYQLWCWTVFHQVDRKRAARDLLQDDLMLSSKKTGIRDIKNTFIYARRRSMSSSTSQNNAYCQPCPG